MAPASKFSDLSPVWQTCFSEGWQAFLSDNVPIGAAITDGDGKVLFQSRNRISDLNAPPRQTCNSQIAHAELNTILMIEGKPKGIHDWHIYSLVEPCPLCMGAIYMAGLRHIHYAFSDAYAGSTDLLGKSPYLSRKPIKTYLPEANTLHEIVAAQQMEFNLRRGERFLEVADAIRSSSQSGAILGELIHTEHTLQQFAAIGTPAADVYDQLAQRLASLEAV
jgi:tRNA(adenine34) deaminase